MAENEGVAGEESAGAPKGKLMCECYGIFAVGKLMQNPCPIRFRMAVLQGRLTRC